MPTVAQLIESLSKFPADAPVEISVDSYYTRFPVFYADPKDSHIVKGAYADMRDGRTVRININMPETETHFGAVTMRKK